MALEKVIHISVSIANQTFLDTLKLIGMDNNIPMHLYVAYDGSYDATLSNNKEHYESAIYKSAQEINLFPLINNIFKLDYESSDNLSYIDYIRDHITIDYSDDVYDPEEAEEDKQNGLLYNGYYIKDIDSELNNIMYTYLSFLVTLLIPWIKHRYEELGKLIESTRVFEEFIDNYIKENK